MNYEYGDIKCRPKVKEEFDKAALKERKHQVDFMSYVWEIYKQYVRKNRN